MKTIEMIKFWPILATRTVAKSVFSLAEKNNFNVIFDFDWVKFMNSSFADELFAKAIIANKKSFKVINIADEFMKKMIVFVTEARKNSKEFA